MFFIFVCFFNFYVFYFCMTILFLFFFNFFMLIPEIVAQTGMLEFTELTAPASSLGSARRGKQSRYGTAPVPAATARPRTQRARPWPRLPGVSVLPGLVQGPHTLTGRRLAAGSRGSPPPRRSFCAVRWLPSPPRMEAASCLLKRCVRVRVCAQMIERPFRGMRTLQRDALNLARCTGARARYLAAWRRRDHGCARRHQLQRCCA